MDINEVFNGIGKSMLAEFDHISSQVPHAGAMGTDREDALARFLDEFLPRRYSVSRGFVMDASGAISSECDVIVYDTLNCPPLYVADRNRVFPCEAVQAVIEVKSVLTASTLNDAMRKAQQLKKLARAPGPAACAIFAYRSQWRSDPIDSLAEHIQAFHAGCQPSEYLDLACILDSGIVQLEHSPDEMRLLAWVQLEKPVLLWFFIALLDLLQGTSSAMPNYAKYSQGMEIGIVRPYLAHPHAAA